MKTKVSAQPKKRTDKYMKGKALHLIHSCKKKIFPPFFRFLPSSSAFLAQFPPVETPMRETTNAIHPPFWPLKKEENREEKKKKRVAKRRKTKKQAKSNARPPQKKIDSLPHFSSLFFSTLPFFCCDQMSRESHFCGAVLAQSLQVPVQVLSSVVIVGHNSVPVNKRCHPHATVDPSG